jgi:hypothetical protein
MRNAFRVSLVLGLAAEHDAFRDRKRPRIQRRPLDPNSSHLANRDDRMPLGSA